MVTGEPRTVKFTGDDLGSYNPQGEEETLDSAALNSTLSFAYWVVGNKEHAPSRIFSLVPY